MGFGTGGLEVLETDNGAIELAFDGAHVADQTVEAGGGVGGEEIVADFEGLGFAGAGSGQTPGAGSDLADDLEFELPFGFTIGGDIGEQLVEVGLIFAGDDDLAGSETVLEGIAAGDGFALGCAWTGSLESVAFLAEYRDGA